MAVMIGWFYPASAGSGEDVFFPMVLGSVYLMSNGTPLLRRNIQK
jgi:hypothetical protein